MSAQAMQPAAPEMSSRAADMPRSSIRRIFAAAKEQEARGHQVIGLHIGDPAFETPPRITAAIKQALDDGHTHYGPVPGLPQLRKAISEHVIRKLDLGNESRLTWEHIVCNQGATQGLNACFTLACDQGTGALLPQVYFPNYMQQLSLLGVRPWHYEFNDEFQPDLEMLEQCYDSSQRVLLINSPSNPTGALFPPEAVRGLYDFARRHNLWIISDEAYIDFVFEGEYLSPLAVDFEYPIEERRVLGIFSFSKSFAVTGLRMGWTVCPRPDIAMQLGLMNEPYMGSLTVPLMYGMLAALAEDDAPQRRRELEGRRELATRILRESGFDVQPPAGGIFFFLDISATGLSGDEFADALLEEEHVAVVPGSGFGLRYEEVPGGGEKLAPCDLARRCIRLCFARPEQELKEGVARLARLIERRIKGR